ncbi:MAG: tryptophan synthase subunit alpha [Gammaproteobacteria bacterium]|nr:tryptophan synthase subunit alpha [Gammaproteobacteria bacterium]
MNRITHRFKALKSHAEKALIPFIAAGDRWGIEEMPLLLQHCVRAGADLLEIGVPFSDPMADGPIIQAAYERALKKGVTLANILQSIARFRQVDAITPIILMSYTNPIEQMGYGVFAEKAQAAGVDGCLVVDCPFEEGETLHKALTTHQIDPILLVSPTTPEHRIEQIAERARGFLYGVSLKGITGAHHLDVQAVTEMVQKIRRYSELPIGIGFGIHDAKSGALVAKVADAVIIGSAFVKIMESGTENREHILQRLQDFLHEIKNAITL